MPDQIPTPADVAALNVPEPAAATPDDTKPPWGDDFDAEKAWNLVQNLRADKDKLARRPALSDADKAKLAEYDRLEQASKTDAERAQEARQAAESRAAQAFQRAARAEVKAALAGLVDDPAAIVEDLDMSRFVDADGDVNEQAVAALKGKYAGFAGRRAPRPDVSQASGANGASAASPAAEFASILRGQIRS